MVRLVQSDCFYFLFELNAQVDVFFFWLLVFFLKGCWGFVGN